jgi:hypothetical protein
MRSLETLRDINFGNILELLKHCSFFQVLHLVQIAKLTTFIVIKVFVIFHKETGSVKGNF